MTADPGDDALERGPRQAIPTSFGGVDRLAHPEECIRYLDDIAGSAAFRPYKRRALELLDAAGGERVLEIGCGTGDDTARLADAVGPDGLAVGCDRSRRLVEEARSRIGSAGDVPRYVVADAHALPFRDGAFDAARTDRVLMHVASPGRVLREMVRVSRPGGRVVAAEPDWETLVIDAPDRTLTRKVRDTLCDTTPHGWIGRRLHALFREHGLDNVTATAETVILTDGPSAVRHFDIERALARLQQAGEVTGEAAGSWLAAMRRPEGGSFMALTIFLVHGTKPG